jgi:hypothetical protein
MGKYGGYYRKSTKSGEEKRRMSPVWRGIGFGFMIIVPFMAYAGAMMLLDANNRNHWFAIPGDLLIPKFTDPMILVKAVTTLFLAFLGFMVIFFIGLLFSRLFGPKRYGPMDAPPIKYQRGKSK